MNYHNAFRSGWLIEVATHEIACDTETNKMSLVQNINTGEIDFVLPGVPSCSTPSQSGPEQGYPTRQIVFSLSSDQHYYAITDNTEYTSLYDAETGARIAMLNFYGFELAFSEDSRTLITTGHYATATWEIQELVNRSLQ
jgi:hypothetical protein